MHLRRLFIALACVAVGACHGPETPHAPQLVPAHDASAASAPSSGACAALDALRARDKMKTDARAAMADAGPEEQGGFGESRVARGSRSCSVADDNIARLEGVVLAEKAPAPAEPLPSWNRTTAPTYLDRIDARFTLTAPERTALSRNGFVVPARLEAPSYGFAFHEIYQSELPVLITADALLDAVYAANDKVLVALEQTRLEPALKLLLAKLACALPSVAGAWPDDVARDVDLYVTVAGMLANPGGEDDGPASDVRVEARAIAGKLHAAEGLLGAPDGEPFVLFGRPRVVDASAFRPRGHYANGMFNLESYFVAATWLSRLELNLKSRSSKSSHPSMAPDPGETPREDLDALALAELVEKSGATPELALLDRAWGLLAGAREDVPMAELSALRARAGIGSLRDRDAAAKLQGAIGEGWRRTARTHFTPQGSTELPAITTMLGPRIEPDATAARFLVHDAVPGRTMIHAADMAYALGNDRAKKYLAADLAKYPGLADGLTHAREATRLAPTGEDLYGAWFDALRGLAETPAPAAPSFMRTDAWRDLRLDTLITGFGELRHNYVLMAAGTYDSYGCAIPDGWVEPAPAMLDALIDYADRGSKALAGLDPADESLSGAYFQRLARVVRVLRAIVEREIAGQPLTEDDRRFLGMVAEFVPRDPGCMDSCAPPTYTGWWYDLFQTREADGTADPSFIADYYASTNAGQVAYVGARRPHFGVFVVDAGGPPRAMVGPVASGFEYVGSIDQRLTDADGAALEHVDAPWAASYTVAAPPSPFGKQFGARWVRPAARPTSPMAVEVRSDRALGPVTLQLLDHHRRVVATQTRPVGTTPVTFTFEGASVAQAQGLRARAGGASLEELDGFNLSL